MDGQYSHDDFIWSDGLASPAAIVNVENGTFKTSVINYSDQKKYIPVNPSIELEQYSNANRPNSFAINTAQVQTDIDHILTENLKRIRVDHLNDEERREITRLCYQYRFDL